MTGLLRFVVLFAALSFAPSAFAAPVVGLDAGGSSRLELLPDWSGDLRVRAAHSLRLGLDVGPRWRVDLHAAARFGGSWNVDGVIDLYRASVRYDAQDFGVVIGRVVEPGSIGRLLLDGAVVRIGDTRDLLGARAWIGHSWHPEAAWTAHPTLTGGGELRLRPRRPGGGAGPVVAALGGSMRGGGELPEGRVWLKGDGVSAVGGRWNLSVEAGFGEHLPWTEVPPIAVKGGLRGPVGRVLDLGIEARWEGLPLRGIPLGLPTPLELLAPSGYGVARAHVGLRAGPVRLALDGGPTVQPVEGEVVRYGGVGKLRASAPVAKVLNVSGVLLGASFGSSWAAGGGAGVGVDVGPLDAELSGTLLRHRGLDHAAAWVGEGRLRAGVLLPLPSGSVAPTVRIYGEVAGGADRLLDGWIRGGVGVDLAARGTPRRKAGPS